jgi:hypothetical protein
MSDASFCFLVRWAGSNIQIGSLKVAATNNPAWQNNTWLQDQVAKLVNIKPRSIKILLGSPAGPQLTPVLFTSASVCAHKNIEDSPSHKSMVAAWSGLTTDRVFDVFVTQHSIVALAISKMARKVRRDFYVYTDLPLTLRRNPVVALAALDMSDVLYVNFPCELKTNKQFALAAISQTSADYILWYFSSTLRDDEEVVLQAVARKAEEIKDASERLQTRREFVLDAVSVNGLCITCVAPEFRLDKDVALAAVRQNTAALEHLCDALKADTDIQQAFQSSKNKT